VDHGWKLRLPSEALVRRYFDSGLWTDDTFPSITLTGLAQHASASFRVRSAVRPFEGTIGQLGDLGLRLAGALRGRGIGPGDVVAFQLPNWPEAAACFYGLLSLGAVLVPVVHIYGAKEIGHILRQSRARVLITADRFGRQDYLANLDPLLADLPDLELVLVVDTDGPFPTLDRQTVSFTSFVADATPVDVPASVDPDDPVVIGYTSGTTSAPKGVVHTHRTLLGEIAQYAAFMAGETAITSDEASPLATLSGAPMSHITGLLGVLAPLHHGVPVSLVDVWDAKVVLAGMVEDHLRAGGGSTFFLTSLLDHPEFDPVTHVPLMRRLGMGGSPIPAEVSRRAQALGISLVRNYGCTEHPSMTGSLHGDPDEKKYFTDGRPLPEVEIRLVDDAGRDVGPQDPGEILSRGPDLFAGYTDPALTDAAIDVDGWYATGDIGVLDRDGYLTITDRKKDIIIRGGENVSAAEVEELLQAMSGVAEVAVVAAPDPRYGEHGCAMVRLSPGSAPFELEALRDHLESTGLARQKWPEELRFVEEFPRTPSGKVQKHVLRDELRGS
jgi:acyl-CoA synthetase (AMP-forming)/AMP-acid ligase II